MSRTAAAAAAASSVDCVTDSAEIDRNNTSSAHRRRRQLGEEPAPDGRQSDHRRRPLAHTGAPAFGGSVQLRRLSRAMTPTQRANSAHPGRAPRVCIACIFHIKNIFVFFCIFASCSYVSAILLFYGNQGLCLSGNREINMMMMMMTPVAGTCTDSDASDECRNRYRYRYFNYRYF